MKHDPVMLALSEQVACYRRLIKLAAIQRDHIQNGRTDELLKVLQARQEVVDTLAIHERALVTARQDWAAYSATLTPELRQQAETLFAETKTLLEQITRADKNDVMVLQQRKLNIGKQIQKTAVARVVNKTYAAAAYAAPRSRVDVQT